MRPSSESGRLASRPADQPQRNADIGQEIARLGVMTMGELRSAWRGAFESEPPAAFSKDLLARAISCRLQEQAFGGLGASTVRLLRSLLRPGVEPPRQVKVGSVIVREHKGVLHEVMVVPGGFCWQGKTYHSLSAIARKITGVSWNGPRFFGLRAKEASENTDRPHAWDQAAQTKPPGRAGSARGRRSSIGAALSPGRAP